jgi:hypothetical protein
VRLLRITQLACLIAICSGGTVFAQAPLWQPARESLPDRELIVATKEAAPFAMKGPEVPGGGSALIFGTVSPIGCIYGIALSR